MKTFDVYDKFDCRCTAEEVGQPWEYRWGVADSDAGLCLPSEVGSPRPPDQPVTDEDGELLGTLPSTGVIAQLERALASGGTSLAVEAAKHSNVLAIVVRHKLEQEAKMAAAFPAVTDAAAWHKLMADVAKEVQKADIATVATPAILLMMLHMKGGKLYGLGELLRRT